MQHCLTTESMTAEDWFALMDRADVLKRDAPRVLDGQTWLLWFAEPSTRTLQSFAMAVQKLGGTTHVFQAQSSSLTKGESATATLKTIEAQGYAGIIIRTPHPGEPERLSKVSSIPIINAGDGMHQHPTQVLTDLYTLRQRRVLDGMTLLIVGDIKHSRVARSHCAAAEALGYHLVLSGPERFRISPKESSAAWWNHHWDMILPDIDAIMMVRTQTERLDPAERISPAELREGWGLTLNRAKMLRFDTWILHPGPVHEGVEIDREVMADRRCLISDQVSNGVLTRAAILWSVCQ